MLGPLFFEVDIKVPVCEFDVAIIGGGIVGLATAWQIQQRFPDRSLVVLEKENDIALHQSGRNSGVLHSGIYYKPGSLKAENCREGKKAMEAFCRENQIPYEICGKVIVALNSSEETALERILQRGKANGVRCELIDRQQLAKLEPHAAGTKAIHVPEAGIVDYRQVCKKLAELIQQQGGQILTSAAVTGINVTQHAARIKTDKTELTTRLIINCCGLHCDRVARLGGGNPHAKIVPFRGEYYQLKPEKYYLCKNLIYPVPDPKFPFLGVHFTRMIDGSIECGPNAVLAFAREGYRKRNINFADLFESLTYRGFAKMAFKHWRMGFGEMWRSISKSAFVKALQRLMPEITVDDLLPAPAGIRAQAVLRDGTLVDDFLIERHKSMINVINAPSPAATASLNIAKMICDQIEAAQL
jgi:(S)-2-hydroxyglutarate dehydrogenase